MLPKRRFWKGEHTIGRAFFCVFCNESSPKSSTHTVAKDIENTRRTFCSIFQNLCLGSIQLQAMHPTDWVGGAMLVATPNRVLENTYPTVRSAFQQLRSVSIQSDSRYKHHAFHASQPFTLGTVPMLWFFVQSRSIGFTNQCIYGPMLWFFVQSRSIG